MWRLCEGAHERDCHTYKTGSEIVSNILYLHTQPVCAVSITTGATNCNIQIWGRGNLWFLFLFCKSLRYFIYGLKNPHSSSEVCTLFSSYILDKREGKCFNYYLPLVGPNLHEPEFMFVCFQREKPSESPPSIYGVQVLVSSHALTKPSPFTFHCKKKKKKNTKQNKVSNTHSRSLASSEWFWQQWWKHAAGGFLFLWLLCVWSSTSHHCWPVTCCLCSILLNATKYKSCECY